MYFVVPLEAVTSKMSDEGLAAEVCFTVVPTMSVVGANVLAPIRTLLVFVYTPFVTVAAFPVVF
jgi:hypothetical protein